MVEPTGEQDKRTFSKVDMIEFGIIAAEKQIYYSRFGFTVTEKNSEKLYQDFIKQREKGNEPK